MDFEPKWPRDIVREGENETKQECVEIDFRDSDDCKIQNLCRICLSTHNEEMFQLLATKDNEPLSEMFTSFTTIEINPEDGLPLHICTNCKNQVVYCYEFKIKCLNADCTLKSLLKGEFVTKEPNDQEIFGRSIITVKQEDIVTKCEEKEVKLEEDLSEDIQYLEDFSDSETLCSIQSSRNQNKKDLHVSFTDSNILLNEVISKPKTSNKKQKLFFCDICSKKFVKLKALRAHMTRVHSSAKDPYSCQQCKQTFSSDHDLSLHAPLHAKGPVWTCTQCKKEFKVRAMLRRHVLRHMERKRYACETCGKPFAELYALRRHARVHTGERVEKRHQCTICDKRYSEQGQLAAHMSRHSGERPCVCASCGKSFPSARLLASHHLVHSDEKPYACRYCDKRFRHESTRNTHHRTHTGEKPYVCAVCGKAFIQNSNLTLHMRTHTGERPYSCETCGRKFSSGSTLKSHMVTHSGEKPYSCDVCGKKFARKVMGAHARLHSGERPHACGVCGGRFATPARLRDHCRAHTGEKPFECSVCTMKFSTKSHLVKHAKTHKSKKKAPRELIIVRHADCEPHENKYVITKDTEKYKKRKTAETESYKEITVDEVPLEIDGELVLQDDSETKHELVVVDDIQEQSGFQEAVCLNSNSNNYINNDITYGNDVNLVTMNEGEISMTSNAVLEGTTVKLYQLDQSLVQIHTTGNHVTISKITSKMTANF